MGHIRQLYIRTLDNWTIIEHYIEQLKIETLNNNENWTLDITLISWALIGQLDMRQLDIKQIAHTCIISCFIFNIGLTHYMIT